MKEKNVVCQWFLLAYAMLCTQILLAGNSTVVATMYLTNKTDQTVYIGETNIDADGNEEKPHFEALLPNKTAKVIFPRFSGHHLFKNYAALSNGIGD